MHFWSQASLIVLCVSLQTFFQECVCMYSIFLCMLLHVIWDKYTIMKKAEDQRIDAFELWCWRRLLRVPWAARRSNQSVLKESWAFFGRNDAKAKTPVLWPPHTKSWLIGKDSDAGKDWGQEEKGMTEDEMAGWHHWLDGREFEWTQGVGDGQGDLACYDSWGTESDKTEWLNWT